MSKPFALVIVTAHDVETSELLEPADHADAILSEFYEVVNLLPPEEITRRRIIGELERNVPTRFGFFCAHGSELGLLGGDGSVIIDEDVFAYMPDSVVVAYACIKDRDQARLYVEGNDRPRAIIGFSPSCAVTDPEDDHVSTYPLQFARARRLWIRCVLNPLERLILDHVSVDEAYLDARRMWRDFDKENQTQLDRIYGPVDSQHEFIFAPFKINSRTIERWGDPEAHVWRI